MKHLRPVLISLVAALCVPMAAAQNYPAKPVRLVVPFAAGGTAEQFADTIRADAARWAKVVNDAGIRIE